ncbi:MAG TPA: Bax inhibitor-1 family protein [Planctomycetota bacterium]|nr:Bax inhibitor-1 family protein [Planctomycetota bacterium]
MAFTDMSLEERFAGLDDHKARFVSKVYSGLTVSLVVAAIACVLGIGWFNSMPRPTAMGIFKILMICEVVLLLIASFVRLSGPLAWAMLFGIVSLSGVTLAPILIFYERIAGVGTIAAAIGLTGTIFLTLTAYVRYSGKDFSYLGGFLWMATIALILTGLASIFFPAFGQAVHYWKACIGALIFSGWILFDTSAVTRQYYREDNVVGAILTLYLDIVNLFIYILQILGNRKD